MVIPPPAGLPYHRLARTARHRWWRQPLTVLAVGAVWFVLATITYGAALAAGALAGQPSDADGMPKLGQLGDLALGLAIIAVLLPVVLLGVWLVQRRPAGTVSSVQGRVRWKWLAWCLLPATATLTVTLGAALLLDAPVQWAGWAALLPSLVIVVLLVPVQAAAEEYAFRGLLLQAVGAVVRRPWFPIVVQAVLFAAVHGWGTPWGFADLVVFGCLAGYLTVRTGGVEAAVALHVVNNVLAMALAAATGVLTLDETAADLPWQMLAVDVPLLTAYTVVVLRLARRRGIGTLSPEPPPLAPPRTPPAYPYPTHPGYPVHPAYPAPSAAYHLPPVAQPGPYAASPQPGPYAAPPQSGPYAASPHPAPPSGSSAAPGSPPPPPS